MIEVAEVVGFLRAEAQRYEEEAVEHRQKTARTETKSVRAKKRAQARALVRAADDLLARFGSDRSAGAVRRSIPRPDGWSFAAGLAFLHDETGGILRWRKDYRQWFVVEVGPHESRLHGLEAGRGDHTAPPFAEAESQIRAAR